MKNRIIKLMLMLVTAGMIFPFITKGGVAPSTVISQAQIQDQPYIKDAIFTWAETEDGNPTRRIYYAPLVNGQLGEKVLITSDGNNPRTSKGIIVYESQGTVLARNTITGKDYVVAKGKHPSNNGSLVVYTRNEEFYGADISYQKIFARDIEYDGPEIYVGPRGLGGSEPVTVGNKVYFIEWNQGNGWICYVDLGYDLVQNTFSKGEIYRSSYKEGAVGLNVSDSSIVCWYSIHKGALVYQSYVYSVIDSRGRCPVGFGNAVFWISDRQVWPGIYKMELNSGAKSLLYRQPDGKYLQALTVDNGTFAWVEVDHSKREITSAINWLTLSPPPPPPITPPIALRIESTADTVMLRWPITNPPFTLESRLGFSRAMLSGGGSPAWLTVPETPTNNGSEFTVTLPRRKNPGAGEFFRLKQAGN